MLKQIVAQIKLQAKDILGNKLLEVTQAGEIKIHVTTSGVTF